MEETRALCPHCRKELNSNNALEQHLKDKHSETGHSKEKKAAYWKKLQKYLLIAGIFLSTIILIYTFYLRYQLPGEYDNFAKCLAEKGAIIYGNDFCSYTNKQLNWFGNSKKYLNYIKCADNKDLCDSKEVQITPTWEINGNVYSGVQDFKKLSELSGCPL